MTPKSKTLPSNFGAIEDRYCKSLTETNPLKVDTRASSDFCSTATPELRMTYEFFYNNKIKDLEPGTFHL